MRYLKRWYVQCLDTDRIVEVNAATPQRAVREACRQWGLNWHGPVEPRMKTTKHGLLLIEEFRNVWAVAGAGWYMPQPKGWDFSEPEIKSVRVDTTDNIP